LPNRLAKQGRARPGRSSIGVELLDGAQVVGHGGAPGGEGPLRLLPLLTAGAGGRAGDDRQLRQAALRIGRVGHGQGGVAEERFEVLRLGEQGGAPRGTQDAQPLFPGEPLRRGVHRREADAPGIQPFEERPPEIGQPPRQRRIGVLGIVVDLDGAGRQHRAVGEEAQAERLPHGRLEAGEDGEEKKKRRRTRDAGLIRQV
jgi:hypothetical protein